MSWWNSSVHLTLNDLVVTDWELDKLSRKINRCDPHRCTIWKWFLFRQDWIWPLMTSWVISGQIRSCSINPLWQITILIKVKYRNFAVLKGILFINLKPPVLYSDMNPGMFGHVRTCADIWFTARRILNIFYLWYWIKIKRFFVKGEPLPSSSSSTRHTDRRLLSRIWPTVEGFLEIFRLRTFIGYLSDVSEKLTRYFIRKEAERNFIFNQVVNHQRVFHRNQ